MNRFLIIIILASQLSLVMHAADNSSPKPFALSKHGEQWYAQQVEKVSTNLQQLLPALFAGQKYKKMPVDADATDDETPDDKPTKSSGLITEFLGVAGTVVHPWVTKAVPVYKRTFSCPGMIKSIAMNSDGNFVAIVTPADMQSVILLQRDENGKWHNQIGSSPAPQSVGIALAPHSDQLVFGRQDNEELDFLEYKKYSANPHVARHQDSHYPGYWWKKSGSGNLMQVGNGNVLVDCIQEGGDWSVHFLEKQHDGQMVEVDSAPLPDGAVTTYTLNAQGTITAIGIQNVKARTLLFEKVKNHWQRVHTWQHDQPVREISLDARGNTLAISTWSDDVFVHRRYYPVTMEYRCAGTTEIYRRNESNEWKPILHRYHENPVNEMDQITLSSDGRYYAISSSGIRQAFKIWPESGFCIYQDKNIPLIGQGRPMAMSADGSTIVGSTRTQVRKCDERGLVYIHALSNIHVDEHDKRVFALNGYQLDLIFSLHQLHEQKPHDVIVLNFAQRELFKTLPVDMRLKLKNEYLLTVPEHALEILHKRKVVLDGKVAALENQRTSSEESYVQRAFSYLKGQTKRSIAKKLAALQTSSRDLDARQAALQLLLAAPQKEEKHAAAAAEEQRLQLVEQNRISALNARLAHVARTAADYDRLKIALKNIAQPEQEAWVAHQEARYEDCKRGEGKAAA